MNETTTTRLKRCFFNECCHFATFTHHHKFLLVYSSFFVLINIHTVEYWKIALLSAAAESNKKNSSLIFHRHERLSEECSSSECNQRAATSAMSMRYWWTEKSQTQKNQLVESRHRHLNNPQSVMIIANYRHSLRSYTFNFISFSTSSYHFLAHLSK